VRRYDEPFSAAAKSILRVLIIILAVAATPRIGGAATTLRVGYPQLNGRQTPLWNIAGSRIDQRFGLDLKPIYIPGRVRLTIPTYI
jgi:hypothetical protein